MCKCFSPTIPAANLGCANCVSGKSFFLDQGNILDTNMWGNTGAACVGKGTPPYLRSSLTTVNTAQLIYLTQVAANVAISAQVSYRLTWDANGYSGTLMAAQRLLQYGTGVNGQFSFRMRMTATGLESTYRRFIEIYSSAGTLLYQNVSILGVSPMAGYVETGTVKAVCTNEATGVWDFYLNGTRVVASHATGNVAAQRFYLEPGFEYYVAGANNMKWDLGLTNIYLVGTGYQFTCCG